MKYLLTISFIFFQLIAFAQTKEDVLICFEMITEHDSFLPAFENRSRTGEDLVIVTQNRRSINQNKFEKIIQSLTEDDFYDFRKTIKVIQGDNKTVENLGYNPRHLLNFGLSGKEDILAFTMSTLVEDRNLNYNWNFKFVKKDGEWELVGDNVFSSKNR